MQTCVQTLCIDMCIGMCVAMFMDMCIGMYVYRHVHRHFICMCSDMCIGMCTNMCFDMYIDSCMDICTDICTDMCIDMCIAEQAAGRCLAMNWIMETAGTMQNGRSVFIEIPPAMHKHIWLARMVYDCEYGPRLLSFHRRCRNRAGLATTTISLSRGNPLQAPL